ncbi:SBF-like CPA transporter family-domain-containing protein [Lipomyces japonicus]|uniref:SBF-like CPA transporter family-domain-containing protein n=1 Tax=Lipomyces japonicus TaxID=56871 RepID=UPI0034CE99C0
MKNWIEPTKSYIKSITLKKIYLFILDQWFLECLGISILIAYLVPNLGRKGGWIAAQYSIIYVCPAIIFFISGLTMDSAILLKAIALYRVHLVAQILSYLYASSIFFGFASAALAANDSHLNLSILGGLILLGCTPTTIGSNIVFTRNANGNHHATLIEVTIGNLLAPALSPALISMYMSASEKWGELAPGGSSGGGYNTLYRSVFKQLGFTVFIPLFVGQFLRFLFTSKVKFVAEKLKINKISSACLVLIIWSSFSSCFYTGAFKVTSPQSTALVLMLNIGCYWLFMGTTLLIARGSHKLHFKNKYLESIVGFFRFNKRDTIALCFVVPAKTPALGVPLINALYNSHKNMDEQVKQMLQIPILLYQMEQLCFSQISVGFFKRWVRDEIEAANANDEADVIKPNEEKNHTSESNSYFDTQLSERSDEPVVAIVSDGTEVEKINGFNTDLEKNLIGG